jgi:hypothetical protein
VLSKNEVAKLKSLRGKLIVLYPELDGLQAKYRIVYVPEGTTYIEQRTDLVNFVYEKFSSLLNGKKTISQLDAHRICRILHVVEFPQEEVYLTLQKERYKK